MDLSTLRQQNIHIVGATSAEGSAILDFLLDHGCECLTAHDVCAPREIHRHYRLTHLTQPVKAVNATIRRWKSAVTLCHADDYLKGIEHADLIFVTQAWFKYPPNFPKLPEVRQQGIPFRTITQLYFELFPGTIIGITGTNGKSTTTALVAQILEQEARLTGTFRVLHSGNERHVSQVLDQLEHCSPADVLVLEISNRQLIELDRAPHIATITNITPDHLDDHPSFADYVQIKTKMFRLQTPDDVAILNRDHELTRQIQSVVTAKRVLTYSFKGDPAAEAIYRDDHLWWRQPDGDFQPICHRSEFPLRGNHNIENALAAILTTKAFGARSEAIQSALQSFRGLPYRTEVVATLDGVEYINDVKSTTPAATIAALQSLSQPVILIAGGGGKGDLDYQPLAHQISQHVKALILLSGEGATAIAAAMAGLDTPLYYQQTLEQAILQAKTLAVAGDVVLLSPACPYFSSTFGASPRGGFTQLIEELQQNHA
ncbi:MAG: UDP-N-acetylmuramoyl-L-alanine--D-glutamate ligase [Gemmatimonadetes bacterium]|nr:MAG: UDP-N-acetylmuramoyl-L-alanine--D-glutamate ligase [Gemmatimonadota bacterium]